MVFSGKCQASVNLEIFSTDPGVRPMIPTLSRVDLVVSDTDVLSNPRLEKEALVDQKSRYAFLENPGGPTTLGPQVKRESKEGAHSEQ